MKKKCYLCRHMNGSEKFRAVCIIVLWLALCYLVVAYQPFTFMVGFTVVASGIVVFVPLWKKYVRNRRQSTDD